MSTNYDLTSENVFRNQLRFSIPYLIAAFLQTFYGLADLYITGQFYGSDSITAVSVGSQVTHMLTVIIVGLSMGTTVRVAHATGAKDGRTLRSVLDNTIILFGGMAVVLTVVLFVLTPGIIGILSVPAEAAAQTASYLRICFLGTPFIVAYNVISSIFRGRGDTRHPMYFVAIAGVVNIVLDYVLIGRFHMAATGAALGTIIAQAVSVCLALVYIRTHGGVVAGEPGEGTNGGSGRLVEGTNNGSGRLVDIKLPVPNRASMKSILIVGGPISMQDGLIQVGFLIITIIANRRGVDTAAAVGIVEKLISFLFLVPSAMLSSIAAIVAQTLGAGKPHLGRKALCYGLLVCIGYGVLMSIIFQFQSGNTVALFAEGNETVIRLGDQYMRAYIFDCIFAGIHFCFSGYFTAINKSWISFMHNILSITLVRIPGCILASVLFPDTLYPMGWATPLGSLLSAIICAVAYAVLRRRETGGIR